MSDKIKEEDKRYEYMRKFIEKQGCGTQHDLLEICLKQFDKDWRKCQSEVILLGKCLSGKIKTEGYK